jgi:diguanylate cyclase (GGDEF)-like protein/PAS domain S-box-containing protein
LSTLFDLLPIGAYRSSPEGKILRINAALLQLNGYSSESECIAHNREIESDSYVNPQRRKQFTDLLEAQGQVSDFVSEAYRLNTGERIWVREHAHLVRDENGKVLYYEGTIEDISKERAAMLALQKSQHLLHTVLHTIPDMVWVKDIDGVFLECNQAFADSLHTCPEDMAGTCDADWMHPSQVERILAGDRLAMLAGKPLTTEEAMGSLGDSTGNLFEVIRTALRDASGQTIGMVGIARDIHQRKVAEAVLRDTTEQLELAIMGADLGRWDHDLTHDKGYYMDTQACQLLGRDPDESLHGRAWGHLVHPDDLPRSLQAMRSHLRGEAPAYEAEYRARHTDGRWVWLSSRGKLVQVTKDGKPLRMVGTLMDVSARKETEEAVKHLAYHDSLTGLPNRRMLLDRLQTALNAGLRHQSQGALLFLDLDHFKQLNDQFGHEAGDLLLQEVAHRLLQSVRGIDTVARLGGDEFVVLVQDLSAQLEEARTHASAVGHKILANLSQPYLLQGQRHVVTPSIGATLFGGHGDTPQDLLKQADIAMYEAKSSGRNALCFYEKIYLKRP